MRTLKALKFDSTPHPSLSRSAPLHLRLTLAGRTRREGELFCEMCTQGRRSHPPSSDFGATSQPWANCRSALSAHQRLLRERELRWNDAFIDGHLFLEIPVIKPPDLKDLKQMIKTMLAWMAFYQISFAFNRDFQVKRRPGVLAPRRRLRLRLRRLAVRYGFTRFLGGRRFARAGNIFGASTLKNFLGECWGPGRGFQYARRSKYCRP